VRPPSCPRYLRGRRLEDGSVWYYWYCNSRDIEAGFSIRCEALGNRYAAAVERAELLNKHLDAWRVGRDGEEPIGILCRYGTLEWMFADFCQTTSFTELAERTKPSYRKAMERLTELTTKQGRRAGAYPLKSITPLAADKLYARLLIGKRGQPIFKQANFAVWLAARAWRIVKRRYPDAFPEVNPFEDVERDWKRTPKKAATRMEAYALAKALKDLGHPHLGLVPLVCYEWHQRPENVLAGCLKWSDIRPSCHPGSVRIEHHKTGEEVWLPLDDGGKRLYPEIEGYLARLPRLGSPVVLTPGTRGPCRPYSTPYAQHLVQKARAHAALPSYVTMDACRHGGMTELGDAEVTEQGIMSLSGHRTPDAARGYVKQTEKQRLAAARKRRAWLESAD
jgi:hypothetical protein